MRGRLRGPQVHSQHSKVPLVAREDYAEPRMVQSLKPLPNRKELGKTFKQLGKACTLPPADPLPASVFSKHYSCLRAFTTTRNLPRVILVATNDYLTSHVVTQAAKWASAQVAAQTHP